MLSVKSWTQDRNVRSPPWPRKISFFKTTFGAGADFSEMGVGPDVFGQVLDTRQESYVPAMA